MSGDAVIAVALWTIFWKHEYISLLATPWYFVITYGLLLSGLLAVSAAIWGCCSIWREARPMICGVSIYIFRIITIWYDQCYYFSPYSIHFCWLLCLRCNSQWAVLLTFTKHKSTTNYCIRWIGLLWADMASTKRKPLPLTRCNRRQVTVTPKNLINLFSSFSQTLVLNFCNICSSNAVVPYVSRNGAKVSGWTQPAWTIQFDRMMNASCPIRVVSLIA